MPKIKKTAVNRNFLMTLADSIYNTKTRSFLRLCDGTLQNGPDPTNKRRPMHCGLGELYYAMTGHQPEDDGVDEQDVVNLAVERSPLAGLREKATKDELKKIDNARVAINKLPLSDDLKENLCDQLDEAETALEDDDKDEDDYDDAESHFRAALDDIPTKNDDGCGHTDDEGNATCSIATFRSRSQRVASQLREAAKLLPR